MPNLSNYTAIASIVAALVALLTLAGGLTKFALERRRQNTLGRFEYFQKMRDVARSDARISEVVSCLKELERDLPGARARLRDMDVEKKFRFLGFFEEIAIMHDSGLISTDVAHYMFGYYCVRCLESDEFWSGVDRESYYWSLFMRFARLMKKVEMERLEEHKIHVKAPCEPWPPKLKF